MKKVATMDKNNETTTLDRQLETALKVAVEDTSVTFNQLAELGIDGEVLAAVRLLTHDKSVAYLDYVRKVKENPIAREVKMSDLRDNMDLKRLKSLTDEDIRRIKKYHEAYIILKD